MKKLVQGTYEFGPVSIGVLKVDKERPFVIHSFQDQIVAGIISKTLSDRFFAKTRRYVYSYRKNYSNLHPIKKFSRYLKRHQEGVYTFRTDIYKYSETFPLDASSPFWPMLKEFLYEENLQQYEANIKSLVFPFCLDSKNKKVPIDIGAPVGSPIISFINNFYLYELDQGLASIPGSFYARYGDDILFSHPDLDTAHYAYCKLIEGINKLKLQINHPKTIKTFLSKQGIQSHLWKGSQTLLYLGLRVSVKGRISLPKKKLRIFLKEVRDSCVNIKNLNPDLSIDDLGALICRVINRGLSIYSLNPFNELDRIYYHVNDRPQLKEIDRKIALIVLETLLEKRGFKLFRTIPYAKLRNEWGLESLLYKKNRSQFRAFS
jgi:hypothetical protein